jgi:hypothetical protein
LGLVKLFPRIAPAVVQPQPGVAARTLATEQAIPGIGPTPGGRSLGSPNSIRAYLERTRTQGSTEMSVSDLLFSHRAY